MTKPDGGSPTWGTWEELILAFAVNRHGTASWDSIATELQKRTSDPNLRLTAQNCRTKYLDLKRRYVNDHSDGGKPSVDESAVPLLEELRKLRVAELRREVQRYDLNIESLELKVKGMEEEREKKTRRSMNESNSTDPEAERLGTGDKKTEPDGTGTDDRTGKMSEEPAELSSEPDRKSVREDSCCNGSSNSIKKSDRKAKTEPEAESDGGGESAKENSDVQSTASRSRKEKERRVNTSGDEREHVDQSQPLFDFLQFIRAHKLGSTLERRLRSQETSLYQKLILQHIDLETVETRLRQGWYSGSNPLPRTKFFRDILLLVNNALVYFPKMSDESNAATEIRALVTREITHKNTRSDSSSGKQVSLLSLSMSKKPEEPDELSKPLMLEPRIPGSLIVCRKRSSIVAKTSSSDKKTGLPQKTPLFAAPEDKDLRKMPSESEEPKIMKKRTPDNRVPSSSPVPPLNNYTKKANVKNNNQASYNNNTKQQIGKGGGGSSSENPKGDNNKKSQLDSKKRGATNFLNRMKLGSPSSNNNNGALLDALKNTPLVTNDGGKGGGGSSEQNKNDNVKRGEKTEQVNRSAAETRHMKEKEKGSPGKRNVGRPPKRGAAATVVVPPPPSGKRGRERGETETLPGKQQPKKRTRKL